MKYSKKSQIMRGAARKARMIKDAGVVFARNKEEATFVDVSAAGADTTALSAFEQAASS